MALTLNPTAATAAAKAVPKTHLKDYERYWRHLRKQMRSDGVWQRWVFARASVNMSTSGLLRAYRYLLRYPPGFSRTMTERQYVAKLRRARVGGQFTVRGGGIYRFDQQFLTDPDRFSPSNPTPAVRDALMVDAYGLARAKTAFALEILDPIGCTAVCLDRHMLRLFGVVGTDFKVNDSFYEEAEAYWLKLARSRGTSPFILRQTWWDRNLGQETCRWWSFVLETDWFDPYAWAGVSGFSGRW